MLDIDTALGWRGKTVRDRDGEKVGTVGDIYLEGESDRPAYAGVLTGLFKRNESIVPLADAREVDGDLVIPYAAAQIRDAPNVDPEVALSEEDEERLRSHYGEATQMAPDSAEIVRSEEEVDFGVAPAQPKERVR